MLNEVLRNKIQYSCYRLIYDSRMHIDQSTLRNELTAAIKALRVKYRKTEVDKLEHKLATFKNEGGWYKAEIEKLAKIIYEAKGVPNDFLGQHRSIEFELIFKTDATVKDFANDVRCAKFSRAVTIKNDGSLRRNEDDKVGVCKEVVVSYRSGNENVVREICRLLRGRAYVNKSCGTHVHFDMRHVNESAASIAGNRLARCVPALRTLLPRSRRTSQYCETIINYTDSGNSRYAFVNMAAWKKYKTIEVRGHSGTINADKILGWIELCDKIMSTDNNFLKSANNTKEVTNITDLIEQYSLDKRMADYIKSRYDRFNVPAEVEEGEEKIEPVEIKAAPAPMPAIIPIPTQEQVPIQHPPA
jgi:hypothetical protein